MLGLIQCNILVVVWLAAWTALKGCAAIDVVAFALFKCTSAFRTNKATGHVTKAAEVANTKMSGRLSMSLLPEIEELAAIAASRGRRNVRKLEYFAETQMAAIRRGPWSEATTARRVR